MVSIITWRKWRDGLELASQALLRCPALSAAAGPPCQSPTSCEGVGMANSRKIAKAIFLIEWHPPQAALRRRCPARGFGVDVGEHTGERRRGGVAHPFPQVPERAVLVWRCGEIIRAKRRSNSHWYNLALPSDLLNVHSGQQFLFRQGCGKLLEKVPVGR